MQQYTMSQLVGVKVYKPIPEDKQTKRNGKPRRQPRIGKVHQLVFSPEGTSVVGFMVKRPDVAGMVKRDDIFVALDSFSWIDEGICVSGESDATGSGAIRRLNLDWDHCFIWGGMDIRTKSGKKLGYITDALFNSETGRVSFFGASYGGADQSLVGNIQIPSGMFVGYHDGWLVVEDAAADLKPTGGLAAKAGEAFASAKAGGKELAGKASVAARDEAQVLGKMVDETRAAYREASGADQKPKDAAATRENAEKAVGRQLRAAGGMFAAFKEEFDKSSK